MSIKNIDLYIEKDCLRKNVVFICFQNISNNKKHNHKKKINDNYYYDYSYYHRYYLHKNKTNNKTKNKTNNNISSPAHILDAWQRGGFREAYGDPPRCSRLLELHARLKSCL